MASLDPGLMYKEPEACLTKMKSLVHRLINARQLAGGITMGDAVIQQYTALLDEDTLSSLLEASQREMQSSSSTLLS